MIRRLLRAADDHDRRSLRIYLLLATVATLLVSGTIASVIPLVSALSDGDLAPGLPLLLGLGIGAAVLDVACTVYGQRLGGRLILRLHEVMATRLARLPLGWFDAERAGSLNQLASRGVTFAANAPDTLFRPMLAATVAPVVPTVVLFALDWRLGLTFLVGAVLVAVVWKWTTVRGEVLEQRVDDLNAEGAARVLEFATAQPAVRAAGQDSLGERSVRSAVRDQFVAGRRAQLGRAGSMSLYAATAHLATLAVVAVTVLLVRAGAVSPAQAVGVAAVTVLVEWLALHGLPFGEGTALAERTLSSIDDLLAEPVLSEPDRPAEVADASVALEGVCFGYLPGTTVVRDISFVAPAGGMTAIVGPSGSGKTTLTRLIARFADVDSGVIRIGGSDVRELGTVRTLAQISVVFQDVYLFQDTLWENIRLGRAGASDAEVLAAAEQAGVTEIADRLPRGFDTVVGEGGGTLSGGERQRVSIARALLKDAPIVLLDEATAALDIESEAVVQRGLAALAGDRTLIVVAHRLQTIRQADRIVVLRGDGTLDGVGTHQELLASSAVYAGFWVERQETDNWSVRPN